MSKSLTKPISKMRSLFYLLLLLLITACSTDAAEEINTVHDEMSKKSMLSSIQVSNTDNPYDQSGEDYLLLLDNYESYEPKPLNPAGVLNVLENIGDDLGIIQTGYIPENLQTIENLQQVSVGSLSAAFSQSGLSVQAQTKLVNCFNGLLILKQQDATYDEAYAYLVSYETTVLSSNLSAEEKEVLLSTLSIVRYDIYNSSARKRKDRDWELSTPNFVATTYGAIQSNSNAVIRAGISNIAY